MRTDPRVHSLVAALARRHPAPREAGIPLYLPPPDALRARLAWPQEERKAEIEAGGFTMGGEDDEPDAY